MVARTRSSANVPIDAGAQHRPGVDVRALERDLAALPGWNSGDYYGHVANLVPALARGRIRALEVFVRMPCSRET